MKKINRIEIIFTLAILLGATSCLGIICVNGNGILASEDRPETGFSGIDNSTSANVKYTLSDNYSIVVEADENLMSYFKTSVSSGVLEISTSGTQCIRPDRTPVIYITGPELSEVYLSGSGDIFADTLSGNEIKIYDSGSGNIISNYAQASEIEIKNSGSGNITIYDIISTEASFKISGSGDISAEGSTETLNLTSTGSGNLNAEDLESGLFNTLISGSGNVYVHVIDELIASLTGSGNLYYTGNPDIHLNTIGSGRIININK
jgi:hypothetical protein